MILVDTGVWIDFFRDTPSRALDVLVEHVRVGMVGVPDLVLTEVLQGCDTDREMREVQVAITAHPIVTTVTRQSAIEAARNYRHLRSLGVTVRKTIDTLIATRCIIDELPLLYSDRDFDPFVRYLGLRSALPVAGVH